MKKAAFYTLGCKVNQYETEAMSELFKSRGYEICSFDSPADIYIINTCTVTGMSDRKSRQVIRRAKRINPLSCVIVTGCYAQTAPDDVLKISDVDIVIGNNDRANIVDIYEKHLDQPLRSCVSDIMKVHDFGTLSVGEYSGRTRAYIKVQDGCSQFCSYCIIPYARGPIRSRPLNEVLSETKRLAERGFTEITYVGIHIASYGLDRHAETLSDLLCEADKIEKIKRIRLSSIEPMTLDEGFIEKIKNCSKLCHHFHLSLQSGCDATLMRMNRKYTTEQYYKIVEGIRRFYPDAAITTDIMVGFAGETDIEFEQTRNFVEKVSFSGAHIFQYSQRAGTPAADFPDQVSPETKDMRSKIISRICERSKLEFMNKFLGKEYEVLFEERTQNGYFEGKTNNYQSVLVKTDSDLSGQYRRVLLEKIENGCFIGKLADNGGKNIER